ncbi:unnamed protein product [Cuscuta europaea]|uniref:Uncharacterized protein n=1 Tax=Cuscuta europaea TaxID=41803 RepID=A0A9P0ZV88_CUSEU|nr:unnamed protein product [Cuscuta europaea]
MERSGKSTTRGGRGNTTRRSSSLPPQTPLPPRRSSPPPQPQTPPSPTPQVAPELLAASRARAYFDDIFGPASTGLVRDHHTPAAQAAENHDYIRTNTPWPYDSSIYYGGQDDIVFPKKKQTPKKQTIDPYDDINDETYANRGDWWKGSYHY